MDELPRLDDTRCTGCSDCAEVCPAACLEMVGGLPWLPRPRACISCALCVEVCNPGALAMHPPTDG